MRIHTAVVVLVGALSVLVFTRPAAAQGAKVDFSAGYQYFRFLSEGSDNVPAGWGASFSAGKTWVKAVADVGGHYIDHEQLHTFQGGVEFSGTGKRVVPFVRVLSGLGLFTGSGDSEAVFVFTPEAGVKLMFSDRVGAQVSAGFPIMWDTSDSANAFRLYAGIVIRK